MRQVMFDLLKNTPVLLLNFNRPHLTKELINNLRFIKPFNLMISIDGPRENNLNDEELVSKVYGEILLIDWECDIEIIRHNNNLGLRKAVKYAIDKFFIKYSKGIILEDDITFGLDFCLYACAMLERFNLKESNIAAISGNNFVSHLANLNLNFGVLTKIFHCWGWATWREKWALYSDNIENDVNFTDNDLYNFLGDKKSFDFWNIIRIQLSQDKVQSWAWRFQLSAWKYNHYFLTPPINLSFNNGFFIDATQTKFLPDNLKDINVKAFKKNIFIDNNFLPYKSKIIDCIENITVLGLPYTSSLDLGCGSIPNNIFNADLIIGIDLIDVPEMNIISCDLVYEKIPFPDNFFNYVTASDFLQYIPKSLFKINIRYPLIELMNEIYRVLKDGGIFLSYSPSIYNDDFIYDPSSINIITEHTFSLFFDDINLLAKKYGFCGKFKIISQERKGSHTISILRKEI